MANQIPPKDVSATTFLENGSDGSGFCSRLLILYSVWFNGRKTVNGQIVLRALVKAVFEALKCHLKWCF